MRRKLLLWRGPTGTLVLGSKSFQYFTSIAKTNRTRITRNPPKRMRVNANSSPDAFGPHPSKLLQHIVDVAKHGASQSEWIGFGDSRPGVLGSEGRDSIGLIEPHERIELPRQRGLRIVTHQLGFG